MKTNTIKFLLFLLPLGLFSCIGDLDVIQKSTINSENMWQNEGDMKAAMYGSFYSFRNAYKTNLSYWGDFRSGLIGPGLGSFNGTALVSNKLTSSETKGTSWELLYKSINDCNMILKYVDEVTFQDENLRNQIKANAYFLRAYMYFTIARVWGDAPLMLEGIESDQGDMMPARTDATLLYEQVKSDIEAALGTMPASVTDRTIGSQTAINMLAADYYLWMYKCRNAGKEALTKASEAVDNVLGNKTYSLLPEYAKIFDIKSKNSAEIIFTMHFERDEAEGGYPASYLIPDSKYTDDKKYRDANDVKTGSQDQWYSLSNTIQTLINEVSNDTRATTIFAVFTIPETGNSYSWINKFTGEWTDNTRYFTSDIPIYRYAEALLFKAEIENELNGDPLFYLNQIAQRAYGKENYYPSTLTKEEINETIFNERLKEFAAEGKSWWDYIRMGYVFTKIPSLLGRQNETNILLWPISSDCFENNPNIRQTIGYN